MLRKLIWKLKDIKPTIQEVYQLIQENTEQVFVATLQNEDEPYNATITFVAGDTYNVNVVTYYTDKK